MSQLLAEEEEEVGRMSKEEEIHRGLRGGEVEEELERAPWIVNLFVCSAVSVRWATFSRRLMWRGFLWISWSVGSVGSVCEVSDYSLLMSPT